MTLQTEEIKAFVPASDFARSLDFYQALGFELRWTDGELAYLCHGGCAFLLQNFEAPDFAANYQMHLQVLDVEAWHTMARRVADRFGTRIGEPADRPWAMRDFTLFDPSGVLWRIAQRLPRTDAPA
ncbi:MAG: VOC family protein [Rubrivivax sp.]